MCIVVDFIFTRCVSYLNNSKSDTIFKTVFVILSYCTLNFEFIPSCGFTFVVSLHVHLTSLVFFSFTNVTCPMKVTLRYYTVAKAETHHLTDYVVHPRILTFARDKFSMDMTILIFNFSPCMFFEFILAPTHAQYI